MTVKGQAQVATETLPQNKMPPQSQERVMKRRKNIEKLISKSHKKFLFSKSSNNL